MFERRFEAVLTMLLAWVTALSLSLAGSASAGPTLGVQDPSLDAARASLELGIAGLAVTALYCLFAGWIHNRDADDARSRALSDDFEPQPDTEAPLIDARGRGRRAAPRVDR